MKVGGGGAGHVSCVPIVCVRPFILNNGNLKYNNQKYKRYIRIIWYIVLVTKIFLSWLLNKGLTQTENPVKFLNIKYKNVIAINLLFEIIWKTKQTWLHLLTEVCTFQT